MSIIATVEQLEAIYGQPNEASTVKVSAKITPPYRALIDKLPFADAGNLWAGRTGLLAARRSARVCSRSR
jgi:predicted pyridoxine 5'-phosphate oxidase superfamily flavin-nucleotide-binding protein